MRRLHLALVTALLAACSTSSPIIKAPSAQPRPAPLFERLGTHARPISTRNSLAQRYFTQGLILAYGFNHAEAKRSFLAALGLDPNCAMCAWGAGLVLGPNINLPMQESDNAEAYRLAQESQRLAPGASPVERALIQALAVRYQPQWTADRSALDRAYADAMRQAARQFPNDPDVLALFAESLMDLYPWNYWEAGGVARAETLEAIGAIRQATALQARHPGALHFMIHLMEEFKPEDAVAAADALRGLVPDAGHLVHMPGHIYLRVGRYADSLKVNIEAGSADESYINQCQVQGFYAVGYHPHNWHFVAVSASLLGNRKQAMLGAEKTGHLMHGKAYADPMIGMTVQHFDMIPMMTAARLGLWDKVLATPAPSQAGDYAAGLSHVARGLALSARGDGVAARAELAALQKILTNPELAGAYVSVRNTAKGILAVGERYLAGELLLRERQYDAAIAALRQAVVNEDALGYNEPEDWNHPARLLLGTAYLEAGQPANAEVAFRGDLARHPENGWALFGLARSQRAMGNETGAAEAHRRFIAAWSQADVTLADAVIR
jgi:tetratricopeptide (TPR) repeat protein